MYRSEHDLIGELQIPTEAYWGIHTARAVTNFPLLGQPVHPELLTALALVKKACALANMKAGVLEERIGKAIVQACEEIAGSEEQPPALRDQFPVDALQGGAGTSTNMNMNEVVANRAIEILGGTRGDYSLVHPNDHVNLSQSTNDVFPTAVKVAALRLMRKSAQAMSELQGALQKQEAKYASVLKLGRTEMQDAVPVTVGQSFAAWAQAIQRDWWRLYKMEERLRQVNLGGTAIGTGLNAPLRYVYGATEILRELTGLGLARAENLIDATQNCDLFVEVSGCVKTAAVDLGKIAADLRLLSSGPRGGFGELRLPPRQAGSSIMPGKVNPVITEAVTQCSLMVMAHDQAITLAAAGGQLELNAFVPLICHSLLESLDLVTRSATILKDFCIAEVEVDGERCRQLLENSAALATALVPYLGYEKATEIARRAVAGEGSVPELVLKEGLLTAEQLAAMIHPDQLTTPGVAGDKARR